MRYKEIKEAPEVDGPIHIKINDTDDSDIVNNLKNNGYGNTSKHVQTINGVDIYIYRDSPKVDIFYGIANNKIVYKSTVVNDEDIGRYQSTVGTKISGIAWQVVIDSMIPNYGSISTDGVQSPDAKKFWTNLIKTAVEKNMEIYFIDMSSKAVDKYDPSSGVPIEKWIDSKDAWGKGEKYKNRRFRIFEAE